MQVLVTGGGGFLGSAICKLLSERGDRVRSLTRGEYPQLSEWGVETVKGDIANAATVSEAVRGCDLVIHTAAKAGVWGRYDDYYRCNVMGTENVLKACQQHGVPKLVYTSSPSVVHSGADMQGADESAPYPEHFETTYPKTKAIAEQMVLKANGPELSTCALRPHLIWGPGDNHLVPRILARGRSGRLRRIGNTSNVVDAVYIDNAAYAHVLAADRLEPGSAVAGKAYFIAQGEPVPLWDLIDRILDAGGLPPVKKRISTAAAYAVGAILEKVYGLFGIQTEPPMTRFVARQLSTSHWFDLTAARRDLGYCPPVSLEEGLKRLKAWLRSQREA